ncbi:NAD(P)-binding protein [Boletus edulis]|nr:NAD(P)-binding protein [Boletus edulis]
MSDSRVWLITGTSAGIGQALVKEVIAVGERVAAITRKASSVSELSAAYPSDKLLVVEYDVGNPSQSADVLFDKVHKHFGRIDVVVNNAGYGLNGVVEGTSDEDARYQFEVNFWGAVRISREAVKYFRENGIPAGRIINVSSVGGFIGNPTLAFYSASKFALEGFGEALHKELPPEWNVKVITVQPGGVRTEWAKSNMIDRPLPPAYDAPDSPANKMRELYKTDQAMGDATKLSRALITISREANPPLRLPLGADSQWLVLNKLNEIKKDVEKWNELTLSSVADDADPLFFKKLNTVIGQQS